MQQRLLFTTKPLHDVVSAFFSITDTFSVQDMAGGCGHKGINTYSFSPRQELPLEDSRVTGTQQHMNGSSQMELQRGASIGHSSPTHARVS